MAFEFWSGCVAACLTKGDQDKSSSLRDHKHPTNASEKVGFCPT